MSNSRMIMKSSSACKPCCLRRRLSYVGLFIYSLFLAYTCPAQAIHDEAGQSIRRIENNIIQVDNTGKETGGPQTLLSRMQSLKVPAVSIAVFDEGRIQWAKGYGLCDKTAAVVVDTSTVFQAASLSKPLAAVAMFALAEKKIIDPDEDINLQLKEWKVPENGFTAEEKVTPRRIVSHMAGLSVPGFRGYSRRDAIPGLLQVLDGVAPANSKPVRVLFTPGFKQVYSGGGYTVLQLLMQEKTGKPFAELMNELVLRPAAMYKSVFSLELADSVRGQVANGHLANGKKVSGGYNIYPEQAAAGLWTTPSDFARFMISVGNAYRNNKGLLQQSTVQAMFINEPAGNGSGFGIEGEGNTLRFSHLGSNVGYYCYAVSFVHTGRGIVVMTNSDNGLQLIREIVRAVYKEYGWPK